MTRAEFKAINERMRVALASGFFENMPGNDCPAHDLIPQLIKDHPSATKDEIFEIWFEILVNDAKNGGDLLDPIIEPMFNKLFAN